MCYFRSRLDPSWIHINRGFSLLEMALVLVILGLVLGTLITPLTTQRDTRNNIATETLLREIHDAILGFAATNGFLPCPANTASNGAEARNPGTRNCMLEHGFVPARTLGLRGVYNNNNLLLDAWLNPVRYSLTSVNTWEYAKDIVLNGSAPSYRICRQSGCPTANSILAANVVAVVYSLGKNGAQATTSPDQLDNTDADNDFVSRPESEAAGSEFDDLLQWVSPNILTLYLVRAGQLEGS